MQLEIRGTWYDGNCNTYSSSQYGAYAVLGAVTHQNHSILVGQGNGSTVCGGYKFQVRDNVTNQIIYNSTSPAASVSLFYDGEPPSTKYDCINGNCILSSTYNTPGIYLSLEDCQVSCGSSCPAGQECVSLADTETLLNCLC